MTLAELAFAYYVFEYAALAALLTIIAVSAAGRQKQIMPFALFAGIAATALFSGPPSGMRVSITAFVTMMGVQIFRNVRSPERLLKVRKSNKAVIGKFFGTAAGNAYERAAEARARQTPDPE